MVLVETVTMVVFVAMIASPAWFFKNFQEICNLENHEHDVDSPVLKNFINPVTIVTTYETMEMIEQSEKILNNLNNMVKNAKNRRVKQLWKIKQAEYMRILRWNRVSNL